MKKIQLLSGLLLLIFAFISCDPSDNDSNSTGNFSENFGSAVNRSFIGQVFDTNNIPLHGVTVTIGTSTVQTDMNGVFIINGANVFEKFAHIKATKAGYIDGSRSMVPTAGKNNVKIMLIPNTPLQTVVSGAASEVALPSGTKVNFDGAFQDESGASYSGDVQVSMFHLKPSDTNLNSLMPGMLYAEKENGNEAVLETFGMLNVELRGSGGQKLNIADGHTAQITMKIDDTQTATAPSSIPLWHFDEEGGYWKEDGDATKVGSNYVGTVSHFSWWNCDAPFPTISLTVTLLDTNGNPLPNIGIGLEAATNTNIVMGYSDSEGQNTGLVPANQTMVLHVYQECGVIYTTTIGPFSGDTVLPAITVPNSAVTATKITGTLLNCEGNNVTNGYVVLTKGGIEQVLNVTNGTFSYNALFCTGLTTFSLRGVDFDELRSTTSQNYTIATPVTNVGTLTSCNSINEYIYYKLDNLPVQYITEYEFGGYNDPALLFSAGGWNTNARIHIVGYTLTPGTYGSDVFQLYDYVGPFYTYANENITYNLIKFGAVGQPLEMTLAGTFDDNYGVTHTISATLHFNRTQ